MNRQEAIKILKAAQTDKFPYDSGLLVEAMDMAISSLETDEAYQLEYERTTKNDLGALDKIRAEIDNALSDGMIHKKTVLGIIDNYKAESEVEDGNNT